MCSDVTAIHCELNARVYCVCKRNTAKVEQRESCPCIRSHSNINEPFTKGTIGARHTSMTFQMVDLIEGAKNFHCPTK